MKVLILKLPLMVAISAVASVVFSFQYSISEKNQLLWWCLVEFNELPKSLLHHPLQWLDYFNARPLNSVSVSYLVANLS